MFQAVGVRAKVGVLEPAQRGQLLRSNTFPGLLLADPASTTYDTDGVLWRLRGPGWQASAMINGVGALVTGIVLLVVAATKAHEGAWIIMLLIPVNVLFFRVTRKHYDGVAAQLSLRGWNSRG